jgi:hypothetical protein
VLSARSWLERLALRALSGTALLWALLAGPVFALAAPGEGFSAAVASLEQGSFDEAIAQLELLADQGFVHPDASFNRAMAYIERARSPAAEPGDLGRAAAALHETLLWRESDAAAEIALERVQAEISRRRGQKGAKDVIARPTLARAAAGLVSENAWAAGAFLGSLALTAGLLLRRLSARPGATLGGAIAIGVGMFLLVACAAATAAARHYRQSSRLAVVVVPEAPLLDATGRPIAPKGDAPKSVPEGSAVYVKGELAGLAQIEWGSTEGFVTRSQLRVLAPR